MQRGSFSVNNNFNFSYWMTTEVLAWSLLDYFSSLTVSIHRCLQTTALGTWGWVNDDRHNEVDVRVSYLPRVQKLSVDTWVPPSHRAMPSLLKLHAVQNHPRRGLLRKESRKHQKAQLIIWISKHIILDDCWWLTESVLVRPMSREMAALNRKSSVKWPVTCQQNNMA